MGSEGSPSVRVQILSTVRVQVGLPHSGQRFLSGPKREPVDAVKEIMSVKCVTEEGIEDRERERLEKHGSDVATLKRSNRIKEEEKHTSHIMPRHAPQRPAMPRNATVLQCASALRQINQMRDILDFLTHKQPEGEIRLGTMGKLKGDVKLWLTSRTTTTTTPVIYHVLLSPPICSSSLLTQRRHYYYYYYYYYNHHHHHHKTADKISPTSVFFACINTNATTCTTTTTTMLPTSPVSMPTLPPPPPPPPPVPSSLVSIR
ncbi:hypothetical protein E2C01_058045 [Portunus trituberculatus]|uniref:Uncharacterized protein n=1 Tax=Portunus trituberculatus TaxID=210409 RepID=A0A5B7H3M3_PORTR|nr:hypothetical protein [Portunus trituberculatus]